jgi:hypothetical protein
MTGGEGEETASVLAPSPSLAYFPSVEALVEYYRKTGPLRVRERERENRWKGAVGGREKTLPMLTYSCSLFLCPF